MVARPTVDTVLLILVRILLFFAGATGRAVIALIAYTQFIGKPLGKLSKLSPMMDDCLDFFAVSVLNSLEKR